MNKRRTKYIHEGQFVAEIEVDIAESESGWPPYISVDDAYKLDDVRDALRKSDVKSATQFAKVYTLTPVQP